MKNLTSNEIQELKLKLATAIGSYFQVQVYSNGTFEILNITDSSRYALSNKLKKVDFVDSFSFYKSSKVNFTFKKGFAEPRLLFNVKGTLTEPINEYEGEKDADRIEEKIELHSTLNPKLWDENNELLVDVKNKVYEIVDEFKRQLKEEGVKIDVKDIYLLGSNANYNYTDESDLDIHIMVDESFDCNEKHLQIIYNAYKSLFNSKYDITIKGIEVELYVENIDKTTNISTGVYSLKKGWLKEPSQYKIPQIDDAKFEKAVADYEKKYLQIMKSPTIEKIDNYIDSLYLLRAVSMKKEGEFGFDNLVFKEIRRLKYLENLKVMRLELKTNELSLK